MAEYSMPFNSVITDSVPDRPFDAEDFGEYIASFFSEGIFSMADGIGMNITTNGDMTVTAGTGKALVNKKYYYNDTPKTFTLDPADGVLHRIDTVVLRKDTVARTVTLELIKGDFSSNPTAHALLRDANGYYELRLYNIEVNGGATEITQANITDTRLNNAECGIVAMAADHVSTTTLYNQIQSDLASFKSVEQAGFAAWRTLFESNASDWQDLTEADFTAWRSTQEGAFETWLATLQAALDENVAASLQSQVTANDSDISTLQGEVDTLQAQVGGMVSSVVDVSLAAASWTGSTAPYTYTAAVAGVTSTSINDVSLSSTATVEEAEAWQSAGVIDGGQAAGNITLKAVGSKPSIAIPVRVIVRGC